MYRTTCMQGLFALRTIGFQAEPDESLKISFYDPIELSLDLCKLQNRYAYQGICQFPSRGRASIPTLYVDGKSMGTLKNLKVQELKALAEPSPFGRGTETIYDENVRKALEIKGSRINLEFQCPHEIQKMAPIGRSLTAKLYKLAIYEKDGFFSEHADTLHGDNHIGTLVVCLPTPHEGGTFILTDDGNQLKLPFDEMIKGDKIPWVAFYTDVKHQVDVVKSGTRMTLQFDLIIDQKDPGEEEEKEMWRFRERKHNLNLMLENNTYIDKATAEYRFQDWNLEILDSIRNKLNIVLTREKEKGEENKTSKEEDSVKPSPMQKRDRPDNDKPLKAKSTKQKKGTDLASPGLEESSDDKFSDLDCVAILLKRRYGATTLSLDTLRGSDSALYHALKDHFRVEVKKIILEQSSDYEGGFKDQPIEIVALSDVKEQADSCSSEDELELGPDDKYIPKKRGTKASKPAGKKKDTKSNTNKKSKEELNVCLVSGFSPKSLLTLVNQHYIEHMGNDAQAASHAYMHAALFVYPR